MARGSPRECVFGPRVARESVFLAREWPARLCFWPAREICSICTPPPGQEFTSVDELGHQGSSLVDVCDLLS